MSTTTTDEGKVANVHPDTSVEAAQAVDAAGQSALIFQFLARRGTQGATAAEVTDGLGLRSRNQVATRLMELREAGRIVRLKRTRSTGPRAKGHIHVATEWATRFAADAIMVDDPQRDTLTEFRALCQAQGITRWTADRLIDALHDNELTIVVRRRGK